MGSIAVSFLCYKFSPIIVIGRPSPAGVVTYLAFTIKQLKH